MHWRLFQIHGQFCTNHPWEVIVAILALTVCIFTIDQPHSLRIGGCFRALQESEGVVEFLAMTVIRSLAVFYCYYQFRKMHQLRSKYVLGIAVLFTIVSSFIFTTIVLNITRLKFSELKDALFFFLLLIDLPKTMLLAQFALNSKNQAEVKNNIAKGLATLGPSITLDTLVETLVIGVGTLSGVQRLEVLSLFACLSVLVNYVVFMTFYPACLSLVLELWQTKNKPKDPWILFQWHEEEDKPNPVLQRVKLIMSIGLMLVHVHSRWSFKNSEAYGIESVAQQSLNRTEDPAALKELFSRWVPLSGDNLIIIVLILILLVKALFFEEKEAPAAPGRAILKEPNRMFNIQGDDDSSDSSVDNVEAETGNENTPLTDKPDGEITSLCRSLEDCLGIYNNVDLGATTLSDEEVVLLVENKHIACYQLEKAVDNPERGVRIRRKILEKKMLDAPHLLDNLPYKNYDYSLVMGACCENVIGYMPIPIGYAGPLLLNGKEVYIPMATTEGCLVASTNRGCRALKGNGVTCSVVNDGMTRGPVVRFPSIVRSSEAMQWIQDEKNFDKIKKHFDSSSRYARLIKISGKIAGRYLFIRFVATTGDAMGMNMLSKGTEYSLKFVQTVFPDMEILSLSGNFCTDKKPAAVNWIEGRGKSVVSEAIIPANIVTGVLKTTVSAIVDVNYAKNMIGSAVAGSIGGFNAHAANIVTAIFLATGQDPAQNVASSNCMTLMEPCGPKGEDLYISCTMPSIEVGTIGGGTILPPQASALDMLGVRGSNDAQPGANAAQLSRVVCGAVLAGELSLMSALTAGHLVKSHLRHNRSTNVLPDALDRNKNVFLPPCKDIV